MQKVNPVEAENFLKYSNHFMIGQHFRLIGTLNANLVMMSAKTEKNCLVLRVDSQ